MLGGASSPSANYIIYLDVRFITSPSPAHQHQRRHALPSGTLRCLGLDGATLRTIGATLWVPCFYWLGVGVTPPCHALGGATLRCHTLGALLLAGRCHTAVPRFGCRVLFPPAVMGRSHTNTLWVELSG